MMDELQEVAQNCAMAKTRMAARTVTRVYNQALRPTELRATQFTILVAVAAGEWDSITELADRLALERSTLSRNLKLLEEEGFIEVDSEGQGRARSMHLTERGRAELQEALPRWREAQNTLEERVGPENWEVIRHGLDELVNAYE